VYAPAKKKAGDKENGSCTRFNRGDFSSIVAELKMLGKRKNMGRGWSSPRRLLGALWKGDSSEHPVVILAHLNLDCGI
jgi:hypothetical protein